MNNFLVAVAVFLIAVLAAAFAVPRAVHWDNYRGVIEEEATRLIGRDVRVGGGVRIRLLPSPVFWVERVSIADTEANTGEPFFQADALRGRLAIAPLLRGVFQASEVVVLKPQLNFVLDGRGGGNWKTFGQGAGQLPFQVSDVALDAVKISGGRLSVYGPDKGERLHLEGIDGTLSAQALDGPFRFRGTFGTEGARRELRFATSKQEPDGGIRFKAALHQNDTGATYNFDARAIDLARNPRVEGELSAKVSLPQVAGPTVQSKNEPNKIDPDAPVEVKAALTADLRSVKLANLNLTFERQGRPQILTGDATIDLSKSVVLDTRLAAKWLDLDQVIGVAPIPGLEANFKPSKGPVEGLLTLAQRLNGFSPDQGQAILALEVEQANLGREAVNGLRLALVGRGAETDIRELRLGLPGGAQADIKGLMTGSGEETSFNGDIVLRGASLARFVTWATAGGLALDPGRDGAFAMRARLVTTPGSVVAREFTGELAGTIMQGELGYRWQGRPEVSVLIEGPRVDLRTVLAAPVAGQPMATLASSLLAASSFGAQAGKTDASLRLRAGELLIPGATFTDAAADVEMRDGRLRVGQLRLSADYDVTIDVEGDVPTDGAQGRGTLRGAVSAGGADGVRMLADLIGIPADMRPVPAQLATLAPLKLAGMVTFGREPAAPLDFTADGDVAETRVTATGRLARGLTDWRAAPLDGALMLKGARGVDYARLLLGAEPKGHAPAIDAASSVVVHVSGTPRDGLVTQAKFADAVPRVTFTGRVDLGPTAGSGVIAATGDLRLENADVATALALAMPYERVPVLPRLSITGRAGLITKAATVRVDGLDAKIEGIALGGDLVLDTAQATLTGRLKASTVDVGALLQPLITVRTAERAGAVWPTGLFQEQARANLSGDVLVTAERLALPGGVGLDAASFRYAFAPSRVELRDLEGRAAGGTWSGAVKLEATREGAQWSSAVRLTDVNLARLGNVATGAAPMEAIVSGVMTLTGRGATPHDIVASTTGRGTLAMSDARLKVLAPAALTTLLQAALRAPADQFGPTIRSSITGYQASQATVLLPARSLEIEIKNGVAALGPVGVETAEGKVLGAATLDLTAMTLATSLRVETNADPLPPPPGWTTTVVTGASVAPKKPPPPLPPVVVTTSAPLGALTQVKIDVSTEALEREIAVRKVERDLEDLERLRKLDEDRGREEADRRRALESGAIPPVAPGAAGLPSAGVVPPGVDASTDATPVPDSVDPSTRLRAPVPATKPSAPAPKPAIRPLTIEEHRKIFGGG